MTTVTSPTMTETGQPRNGTGTMSQSEGDLPGRCFVISDLAAVVISIVGATAGQNRYLVTFSHKVKV